MDKVKLSKFKFQYSLKSRWKDLDSFGHVNNSTYLTYFEDARIALFDRWNLQPKGKSLIVAKVVANYYKQLLHPSDFVIGQKVSRVGNSSFDIQSTMFNEKDEAISDAVITCVCFDFDSQTTQPVYDLIKNDFNH